MTGEGTYYPECGPRPGQDRPLRDREKAIEVSKGNQACHKSETGEGLGVPNSGAY